VHTTIGYEFPTADWLDPFEANEPGTQWFFVNQDRISRAWTAPPAQDKGWGFGKDEPMWDFFTNPRSCLYCMEKSAIVSGGQVLREWPSTLLQQERDPKTCAQHNGLYFVYTQAQQTFPVHEAAGYTSYEEALTEALTHRDPAARSMVARMMHGESLW
jgi:hypothetical protein